MRAIARDDSDTTTIQRALCSATKITFLRWPPILLFGYAPVREYSQSDSDETEISELAEFWWSYGKCGNIKYKRRDVNIRVDFAIYLQIFASLVIVDL